MSDAPRTARARARAELTGEILAAARARLVTDGAAGLSLRAVARDVGMVSSAVYRYFPSRDDLLTALIVESYDDLGTMVETAEGAARRSDLLGRWLALGHAVRDWALAHPHQWALLFGTPVPGYRAPSRTEASGTRIPRLVVALCADVAAAGAAPPRRPVSRDARAVLAAFRAGLQGGPDADHDDLVVRGTAAWATLMGAVSLEVFGQYGQDHPDLRPLFDQQLRRVAPLASSADHAGA